MWPLLLLPLLPLLWAGSLALHLSYWLDVQGTVTVQEGLCVRVPCSFFHSWIYWSAPVHGYWFRQGPHSSWDTLVATNNPARKVREETRGRFRLHGDTRNKSCSLDIRDAQTRDTGTYFFRVEGSPNVGHNYIENKLSVRVTALTQTPDIRVQGTLESGRPGTITCAPPAACDWGTPPTFSWTQAALRSLGSQLPHSSVLTFTPGPGDHGTDLTCRVTFPGAGAGVSSQSTIRLNVSYGPQKSPTISMTRKEGPETLGNSPALPAQEGQCLRLLCAADSNPPALISWFRGSLPLSPSNSFNSGVLDLPRVELGDHGKYICRAHHPLGSRESSLTLLVKKPPQLLGPSCSWEDESLHCCCSAQSQLVPSLRWRLREELLDGNLSNASFKVTSSSAGPWANSSLSLHEGLGSNLRLSCEAQNAHGKQSGTILLLPSPGAGRPGARSGVVLGALGGVAVTILLALCLCVTFFVVRIYRRKLAEKASNPDSNDPALSPVSKGHLNEPCAGSPSDQGSPTLADSASDKEELHYATLKFHVRKSQNSQDQEAEYSEIHFGP
ncbi:sialic acid-binding Ig-like lectin 5 isoform X2 [Phacochoerus africanus]|uniref:sialic acid-binding Ig-like lectin 5 isoform X2 n=1 Tax=Phacochoerus africanus TaxID=41426 RepID=UPI001FD95E10|nr:sialic acid-binding Ig-like lectin 5 isoform X2 [Phacochoerus africanus]